MFLHLIALPLKQA
jgi:hypothetical protein